MHFLCNSKSKKILFLINILIIIIYIIIYIIILLIYISVLSLKKIWDSDLKCVLIWCGMTLVQNIVAVVLMSIHFYCWIWTPMSTLSNYGNHKAAILYALIVTKLKTIVITLLWKLLITRLEGVWKYTDFVITDFFTTSVILLNLGTSHNWEL